MFGSLRIIFLIFFSFSGGILYSQTTDFLTTSSTENLYINDVNTGSNSLIFQQVDSFVSTLKGIQFEYVNDLADSLTSHLDNDLLKVRAIYRWIAENIEYNCFSYHFKLFRTNDYHKVLQKRKTVCAGYAALFNELCYQSGIKCKVIEGYASKNKTRNGLKSIEKHAWNAVWINNSWQLVDATWGAGYTNKRITRFHANYTDYFLFTNPELFLYTHFPKDPNWQLIDKKLKLTEFRSLPFVFLDFYQFQLLPDKENKFYIRAAQNDTIDFKLTPSYPDFYKENIISFYPLNIGYLQGKGNWEEDIEFQFAPAFKGGQKVLILINGKAVMAYYIQVD